MELIARAGITTWIACLFTLAVYVPLACFFSWVS